MNDNPLKDDSKYMPGFQNRAIRYYFYLSNGLNIVNESRNLILGILGVYIALKLDNILYIILMLLGSLIILTIIGYWVVHKVAKVREWLSMRFSTSFGIKSFSYQEESYKLLVEIRDLLKKDADSKTKNSI